MAREQRAAFAESDLLQQRAETSAEEAKGAHGRAVAARLEGSLLRARAVLHPPPAALRRSDVLLAVPSRPPPAG